MKTFKSKKDDLNIVTSKSNYFVSVDESLVSYARQRFQEQLQDEEKRTKKGQVGVRFIIKGK